MAKQPNRGINTQQDIGAMEAIQHNDPAGAKKVIVIEAPVARATLANENVGGGRLVKIAAAPYGLDMVGRVYDSAQTYQKGDVVTSGSFVYLAQEDKITGAFDATKWRKVADKLITGITSTAGNVVSTGRWHNAVTVAGWLIDDDSTIEYTRIRD